jgi:methylated-DNA-protein-cysteine methyltransferase-like protein
MSKSDFYQNIYDVVKLIPKGRVTSYGAIAKYLGSAKSSRVVGWAMNNCHQKDATIPAHRVVNKKGTLTGKIHFNTPTLMQELLEKEGVTVINDQVQNFKKVLWNPMDELVSF